LKQGDIVRTIRKATGLNQADFGALIGKQQEDISDVENNKQYLKWPDWLRIAKTYKCETAQMMAEALMYREVVDFNKIKTA
jgi:transcriptional regulator with XRE-family HTH domain